MRNSKIGPWTLWQPYSFASFGLVLYRNIYFWLDPVFTGLHVLAGACHSQYYRWPSLLIGNIGRETCILVLIQRGWCIMYQVMLSCKAWWPSSIWRVIVTTLLLSVPLCMPNHSTISFMYPFWTWHNPLRQCFSSWATFFHLPLDSAYVRDWLLPAILHIWVSSKVRFCSLAPVEAVSCIMVQFSAQDFSSFKVSRPSLMCDLCKYFSWPQIHLKVASGDNGTFRCSL